jgi:[ribulose-bisphosphate carboxylase]-lysine N-methyltransferase
MQEEKRILEGLAEWFQSRLKSLEMLEYYQERRLKRLGLLDDSGRSTFEDMIKINM